MVTRRNRSRSASVRIEDWISRLDREVEGLSPNRYPAWDAIVADPLAPFLVIRYRRILPKIHNELHESIASTLLERVGYYQGKLDQLSVLAGLSEQQTIELAALVLWCDAKIEYWDPVPQIVAAAKREIAKGHEDRWKELTDANKVRLLGFDTGARTWSKRRRFVATRGRGQESEMNRRLARIRKDVERTRDDIEKCVAYVTGLERPYLTTEAGNAVSVIKELAISLAQLRLPADVAHLYSEFFESGELFESELDSADPRQEITEKLVEYLVHVCRLDRNEAYVRVAKIGNTLWGWQVKVNDRYGGLEKWKDATAIRKRIARSQRRPRDK